MSRDNGFAVMDVSTDIVNEGKFRRLQREAPDLLGCAFIAYVATLGESWKAGRRITAEESWPVLLAFDPAVINALKKAKLLDKTGRVNPSAWRGWFDPANGRREKSRARWAKYNVERHAVTAPVPRGSDAVTPSDHAVKVRSVPPVPSVGRVTPPPPAERGRRSKRTNPRSTSTAPRDMGTSPRANGTSVRQVRDDQKRGPTALASVLRQAATLPEPEQDAPAPIDTDVEAWTR